MAHEGFIWTRRVSSRKSGTAVVYLCVMLSTLAGLVGLGVDFGRVQVAKTQLSIAADAAALYAAGALPDASAAASRALLAASGNTTEGSPVVLLPSDVQTGFWDTTLRKFTSGGSPTNAIQVTAHLSSSRGTAVPLVFASLLGARSCDVNAQAIGMLDGPASTYGITGINSFSSGGLLTVDSYPSGNRGDVASNGDITLNLLGIVGLTDIHGDARPGIAKSVKLPTGLSITHISGSTSPLTSALYYPPVILGAHGTGNDNASLPLSVFNGVDLVGAVAADIPGGTYVVRNLTLPPTAMFRLQGPTTFYVTGTTNLIGTVQVPSSDPANFKVYVVGSGPVYLTATLAVYMDLYAPQSAIQITAGLGYYGRIIGLSINILGTSLIHYDEALGPAGGPQHIMLVK